MASPRDRLGPPPLSLGKPQTGERRGLTAGQVMIRVAAAQVEDWKRCNLFPWAIQHRLTVNTRVNGGTASRCTWLFANPTLARSWTRFFRDGMRVVWPG